MKLKLILSFLFLVLMTNFSFAQEEYLYQPPPFEKNVFYHNKAYKITLNGQNIAISRQQAVIIDQIIEFPNLKDNITPLDLKIIQDENIQLLQLEYSTEQCGFPNGADVIIAWDGSKILDYLVFERGSEAGLAYEENTILLKENNILSHIQKYHECQENADPSEPCPLKKKTITDYHWKNNKFIQ